MGNCIKKESSTEWGGDNWGPLSPVPSDSSKTMITSTGIGHNKKLHMNKMKMEEKSPVGLKNGPSFPPITTGTEVKIKITKKQLKELLSKVDGEGRSVKQVLTQLLNSSDGYEIHPRSWRPALQSIPETED